MLKRYGRYLAWAWEIIVGGLIITPGGVWCIKCGQVINAAGYIGDPAVMLVGVVAIILGVVGLATEIGSQSQARGSTPG
jgi:hypothetical protein